MVKTWLKYMVKLECECIVKCECIVSIINANSLSIANASSALSNGNAIIAISNANVCQLTASEILVATAAVISLTILVCYSLRV